MLNRSGYRKLEDNSNNATDQQSLHNNININIPITDSPGPSNVSFHADTADIENQKEEMSPLILPPAAFFGSTASISNHFSNGTPDNSTPNPPNDKIYPSFPSEAQIRTGQQETKEAKETKETTGNTPLLSSNKNSDDNGIELTEQEKEILAFYIYQNTQDKITPLAGRERYWFGVIVIFALIGAINCKDFGDKFVRGLKELSESFNLSTYTTQIIVAWGITAAYLLAQFSLGSTSLLTVVTNLIRYCTSPSIPTESYADSLPKLLKKFATYLTRKDFILDKARMPYTTKEKIILGMVPPSILASGIFAEDAMRDVYEVPADVAHIGNLRSVPSLAINTTFTKNFVVKIRPDVIYDDDFPILRLYRDAKRELQRLSENKNHGDARKFIAILHDGLLKNLISPQTPENKEEESVKFQKQLQDDVIAKILDFTPDTLPPNTDAVPTKKSYCPTSSEMTTYISIFISIFVSLTNFKGGTLVPKEFVTKEFAAKLPKDLWEFFGKINDQSTQVVIATLIGAVCFGLPSWFINIIINATANKDMFNSLGNMITGVREKGFKNYFSQFSKRDVGDFSVAATGGVLFGCGNGGGGYKYAPISVYPVPLVNFMLSTINFSALGYISIAKLIKTYRGSGEDKALLQGALDAAKNQTPANNLQTYFDNQPNTQKQEKLIFLLLPYVERILDTHIESFKTLRPEYSRALFSKDTQERISSRTALRQVVIVPMNNADSNDTPENSSLEMQPGTNLQHRHASIGSASDSPELTALNIHHTDGRMESFNRARENTSWIDSLPPGLNYHQHSFMKRPLSPTNNQPGQDFLASDVNNDQSGQGFVAIEMNNDQNGQTNNYTRLI